MLIKRAAQICQPSVVGGFQLQITGLYVVGLGAQMLSGHHSPVLSHIKGIMRSSQEALSDIESGARLVMLSAAPSIADDTAQAVWQCCSDGDVDKLTY
jgi:hypothetical protein